MTQSIGDIVIDLIGNIARDELTVDDAVRALRDIAYGPDRLPGTEDDVLSERATELLVTLLESGVARRVAAMAMTQGRSLAGRIVKSLPCCK